MTSVPIKNVRGEVVGSMDLDERVFGIEPNRAVVHQAVVAQLANQRKGTHDTKTRGEVAGGTHKMWRQKGTGRARQGDRRAPHWTGGGVVFGPHPRSYRKAVPRKMRRLAMRSALSARVAEDAVTVVDELRILEPKTRAMVGVMNALGLRESALIVVPERDDVVYRAAANLPGVRTVTPGGLNLLDVLKFRHLVLTRSAAEEVTRLALLGLTDKAGQDEPSAPRDEPLGIDARMDDSALESAAPTDVALAEAAEEVARPAAGPEAREA